MEGNFYVGVIYYGKRIRKPKHSESVVLYSEDNIYFLDLMRNIYYTTDNQNKDYVDRSSLIQTNIEEYRENYEYLLARSKENNSRKKILS